MWPDFGISVCPTVRVSAVYSARLLDWDDSAARLKSVRGRLGLLFVVGDFFSCSVLFVFPWNLSIIFAISEEDSFGNLIEITLKV